MGRRLGQRACLVVCVFFLASVLADGVEEHLREEAHRDAAEVIKLDKQKAGKDHHVESFLKDDHDDEHSKSTDTHKYLKKDRETKAASASDEFGGSEAKRDKAEDSHSDGYKRGHKKGRHNQGFQNSYHKDESSNKSTYFDDFNDEGDQAAYKSKLNSYDNHGGKKYRGSNRNGHDYVRDQHRGGGHDRSGDSGNKRIAHRDYAKDHYLRDLENYNRYRNGRTSSDRSNAQERREHAAPAPDAGWDWRQWEDGRRRQWPAREPGSGWERRPDWRRDYDRRSSADGAFERGYGDGYGESRPLPVAEAPSDEAAAPASGPLLARRKQTITIYEDPRYGGQQGAAVRTEEAGYVRLDVQPSRRRYAGYDDAHFSRPAAAA